MANLYERTREPGGDKQTLLDLMEKSERVQIQWPETWREWPSLYSLMMLLIKVNLAFIGASILIAVPALIVWVIIVSLNRPV